MTIRSAHFSRLDKETLYKILRLRAEVFVVEQNCPYQDLDDNDQNAWHVWAEEDGQVLGCCRVFLFDKEHSQIGRVVTSIKARGIGLGKRLMQKGIEISKKQFPDKPVLIHAQSYASGFYEKLGFRISSAEFLEDNIPHHEMLLD